MKQCLVYIVLIVTIMSACGSDDGMLDDEGKVSKTYLDVSPTSFDFKAEGGTANISISSNASWSFEKDNTIKWITFNGLSGSGNAFVTITVSANTGKKRETTFTVNSGEISKAVKVTQEATVIPADGDNIPPSAAKTMRVSPF